MTTIYHVVKISLPQRVALSHETKFKERDELIRIWTHKLRAEEDFLGISEGSFVPERPVYQIGDETQFEDPARKFQGALALEFYFASEDSAIRWRSILEGQLNETIPVALCVLKQADWNQKWKEGFEGVDVEPHWQVLPTWQRGRVEPHATAHIIWLNPGMGFGAGTHPTTQLCLKALGAKPNLKGHRVLDFGAGSGILSVASALKGAEVDAVEIDPMALESARETAKLNDVEDRVTFLSSIEDIPVHRTYTVIVANILRPVLWMYCDRLSSLLSVEPGSALILSGLLREDEAEMKQRYESAFQHHSRKVSCTIETQDEWIRLEFQ